MESPIWGKIILVLLCDVEKGLGHHGCIGEELSRGRKATLSLEK